MFGRAARAAGTRGRDAAVGGDKPRDDDGDAVEVDAGDGVDDPQRELAALVNDTASGIANQGGFLSDANLDAGRLSPAVLNACLARQTRVDGTRDYDLESQVWLNIGSRLMLRVTGP